MSSWTACCAAVPCPDRRADSAREAHPRQSHLGLQARHWIPVLSAPPAGRRVAAARVGPPPTCHPAVNEGHNPSWWPSRPSAASPTNLEQRCQSQSGC